MAGKGNETIFEVRPIGIIRSELSNLEAAPKQGNEGAPDAWVEVNAAVAEGLEGIAVGSEIILVTWFHKACRSTLKVHPRGDRSKPITGVFSTRSGDRPNPIALHRVTVLEITGHKIKVGPLEAIDGTPVIDIKPVLPRASNQLRN